MGEVATLYESRVAAGAVRPDTAQRNLIPALDRLADSLACRASGNEASGALGWLAPVARVAGLGRSLRARSGGSSGSSGRETRQGLYMWGGVGRGKSMLMDLFVEAVNSRGAARIRRVHFHEFMQEIHDGMQAAREREERDALAPVSKSIIEGVDALALDELHVTDIADAMIVGRLFEALFKAGTIVIATSNRRPDDLYKDGLNRNLFLPFIALIKDRLEIAELDTPTDYRRAALKGRQSFFAPVTREARAEIDRIWNDLVGGSRSADGARAGEPRPLAISVKGRTVTLPAFRDGVARASFHDLCGNPLGPADYLAIAETVKVLVLEDIPRLSRDNFNQAKRFVTLIDALYEAGSRLVASAADKPDMLYTEGAGSFEFERTASRLLEMQGEDWGAS